MKNALDTTQLGVEAPASALARKTLFQLTAIIIIGLTMWIWWGIFSIQTVSPVLYVLDVGQGDSQLVILASKDGRSAIKILIDGGRDKVVLTALDEALGNQNNKYIDIVISTHTDLDHMGGLIEVMRRYDTGIFISNGRTATTDAYTALKEILATRHIPTLVLRAGDVIRYGDNTAVILSPDKALVESKDVNETGVVMMLTAEGTRVLFTADAGFPTENILLKNGGSVTADVLKVGHHGSKYSSSDNFIAAVHPVVSIIGVGAKNTYGHPAPRTLETLALAGSRVYRTDIDGTIKIPLGTRGGVAENETPQTGALAAVASPVRNLISNGASILTGAYKDTKFTTVSLEQARESVGEFGLVPYKKCLFSTGGTPKRSLVIINEIAWMGAPSGATHEWVELRNVSSTSVDMSGWQLINENEKLRVTFPQKSLFDKPYILIARPATQGALGLDASLTFTGALRNSNEGLRLYDNECNLIDEVRVSPTWVAGNNASKQTMERLSDLSWGTSIPIGGTPNAPNRP